MTAPQMDAELARNLLSGITELTTRVEALAELPAQVQKLTVATAAQSRRSKRHTVLIIATITGLLLDGGVSVLFWRQHQQQDCLSSLRAKSAAIADLDRQASDLLYKQVFTEIATAAQAKADYATYVATRAADDEMRSLIGVANTNTCPLF